MGNSKISTIFRTPSTENLAGAGMLAIRLGIAFGFIWAGIGKVSDPAGFGMMLQSMAGMSPSMSSDMALLIGTLELVSGIFMLIGFLARPSAVFQIIILVGAVFMFGFDFTKGPAIWKDPAMLGAVVMLLIYGAGKFSIDHKMGKKLNP